MKHFAKIALTLIITGLLFSSFTPDASAEAPYEGYNYSYWEKAERAAIPYLPDLVLDGKETEYGRLNSPEDLYVANDHIYIADTGNHRIVILDKSYQFISEIKGFTNGSKQDRFNEPQGIFVTEDRRIYVADTSNQRVVELTEQGELIQEIKKPDSDVIRKGLEYYPTKVAVDKANRIYVIGRGIYDGIMEFDGDGKFMGYIGANKVKFNPLDYFWRAVSTRAQRAKMALFIPIEFNNLYIDQDGFIYTTNSEKNTLTPIQRLNPTGTDVLRREGYHEVIGDIHYPAIGELAGGSTFIDISVNDFGMYSALDSKRGRIFTYDEDGNLLYIFGKLGNQKGTFKTVTAIERVGDDLLVLDKGFHNLVVFKPTEFGYNVNEAVKQYNLGNDRKSAEYWEKVLRLDTNNEIAYVGIGKVQLMEGKNREAMEYFKNGNSKKYYSKAFKRYRQEVLRENFGFIMSVLVLIPMIYIAVKWFRHVKRRRMRTIVE